MPLWQKSIAKFQAKTQREEKKVADDSGLTEHGANFTPALAFCGLGNPKNFFEQLQQDNFSITATETFRDHHIYTQQDIVDIEKLARESGAEILLTTAKDAVKLSGLKFNLPCYVVEIEMQFDDADGFAAML